MAASHAELPSAPPLAFQESEAAVVNNTFLNLYDYLGFTPDNFSMATLAELNDQIAKRREELITHPDDEAKDKLIECALAFQSEETREAYDQQILKNFPDTAFYKFINNDDELIAWAYSLAGQDIDVMIELMAEKFSHNEDILQAGLSKFASHLLASQEELTRFLVAISMNYTYDLLYVRAVIELFFGKLPAGKTILDFFLETLLHTQLGVNNHPTCVYFNHCFEEIFYLAESRGVGEPPARSTDVLNIPVILENLRTLFAGNADLESQALRALLAQENFLSGVISYHIYAKTDKKTMALELDVTTTLRDWEEKTVSQTSIKTKYHAPEVTTPLNLCLQTLPDQGDAIGHALLGRLDLVNTMEEAHSFWTNFSTGILTAANIQFGQMNKDVINSFYESATAILKSYDQDKISQFTTRKTSAKLSDKLRHGLFKSIDEEGQLRAKEYFQLLEHFKDTAINKGIILLAMVTNQKSKVLRQQLVQSIPQENLENILVMLLGDQGNAKLKKIKTAVITALNDKANHPQKDRDIYATYHAELIQLSTFERSPRTKNKLSG
jgi:hypothetical protein